MTGIDVVGVAAAATGLLETAISLVGRVRHAQERQRETSELLERHNSELTGIKDIVRLVEDEQALQTAAVSASLVKVNTIGKKLVEFLQYLDPEARATFRQFAHQLVHGSYDERRLTNIMEDLSRAKSDLSLRIQLANVGLTRTIENTIVANIAVVRRVDMLLQQTFGPGQGLKIAVLFKDRFVQGDGLVPLSDSDIMSLTNDAISSTEDTSSPTSRIVLNNVTKEQALQINGPVGEEGWREVSCLEIRENVATGSSIQVNHAVSLDVFKQLLAARST